MKRFCCKIPGLVTANGSCLSLSLFRWQGRKLCQGTEGRLLETFGYSAGWRSEEKDGLYIVIMGM